MTGDPATEGSPAPPAVGAGRGRLEPLHPVSAPAARPRRRGPSQHDDGGLAELLDRTRRLNDSLPACYSATSLPRRHDGPARPIRRPHGEVPRRLSATSWAVRLSRIGRPGSPRMLISDQSTAGRPWSAGAGSRRPHTPGARPAGAAGSPVGRRGGGPGWPGRPRAAAVAARAAGWSGEPVPGGGCCWAASAIATRSRRTVSCDTPSARAILRRLRRCRASSATSRCRSAML
jgi:hypothetical protein